MEERGGRGLAQALVHRKNAEVFRDGAAWFWPWEAALIGEAGPLSVADGFLSGRYG